MRERMKIYCTSRNRGPSWNAESVRIAYLGTSVKEAEKAVGNFEPFQKDEDHFPKNYPDRYSAIPRDIIDWDLIQFYMCGGRWCSIVMFDLEV